MIAIGAAVIAFVIALFGGGGGGGWTVGDARGGLGGGLERRRFRRRRLGRGWRRRRLERRRRHLRRLAVAARALVSIARHLFTTGWGLRRAFDAATLEAIEQAITDTERGHGGEIRFAVEASRGAIDLMRGVTPRQHAVHAFARLGMWDTEANNGVLIYVCWRTVTSRSSPIAASTGA